MARDEIRQKFTKKQREEFAAQRRRDAFLAQNVKLGYTRMPGSGSGGGGGTANAANQTPVGGNVFDTNSYLPAATSAVNSNLPEWAQPPAAQPNPLLTQPLPTGRAFDAQYLNDLNLSRMKNAQEFLNDPKKFAEEHDQELNQEQSLLDKGMSFLGQIFNYEDEADLQVLGMPLAPVESLWDGFMRKLVGAYDLLNIGFGGLISAMPGGVKTLSYDELSGGHDVWDVLNGGIGLKDNVAPSPMQIAITSVAIEAKRIREGEARLSDILLANPATGPFLLAALAAESSPVQKEGFDLLDPEQRKAAFGQGWEQWMSGIGDFGLSFASPEIGVAAGLQIMRMGLLGTSRAKWTAASIRSVARPETDEVLRRNNMPDMTTREIDIDTRPKNPESSVSAQRDTATQARQQQLFDAEMNDNPAANSRFWNDEYPGLADETGQPIGPSPRDTYVEAKNAVEEGTADIDQMQLVTDVDNNYLAWRTRNPLDQEVPALKQWEQYRLRYPSTPDSADDFWNDLADFGLYDDDLAALRQEYARGRDARFNAPRDENGDFIDPVDRTNADIADEIDSSYRSWVADRVDSDIRADALPRQTRNDVPGRVTKTSDELGLKGSWARLINDLAHFGANGQKTMSVKLIMKRKEFRRLPGKGAIARLLHDTEDPYVISLILQSMHGIDDASAILERMAPALSDEIFAWWHNLVQTRRLDNPVAYESAVGMLTEAKKNATDQIQTHVAEFEALTDPADVALLDTKITNLRATVDQVDALLRVLDGQRLDPLDAANPFRTDVDELAIIKDLYRRQDVLERSVRDGVRNVMRSMDADSRIILADNWYAKQVYKSRERRALAAFQYAEEGTQIFPKRRMVAVSTVDEAGKPLAQAKYKHKWDLRWFAASDFEGVGRIRRAARIWRWFGTETPSGYIGLKGAAQIGSENELIAALDLDIYSGEPITVRYLDDNGVVQTKKVGGRDRRDEFVNLFMEYLSDPTKDPMTALTYIENEMARDFAWAYGYDPEKMTGHMIAADKARTEQLDTMKRRGFFIDPDTNKRHYIPWIKSNLANGTYMHNWHAIEEQMQRHALDNYGTAASQKMRTLIRTGADLTINADSIFQQLWRPAILFRVSYTQRNVFEGMLRAMAYYASLAPLLWPVQATAHGISAKVRGSGANRATRRAVARMGENPDYRRIKANLDEATLDHVRVASAQRAEFSADDWQRIVSDNQTANPKQPYPQGVHYFVWERSKNGPVISRVLTPDEWDAEMTRTGLALIDARLPLADVERQLDATLGTSKFGRWRRQNIDDLQEKLRDVEQRILIIREEGQGLDDYSLIGDGLVNLNARRVWLEQRLDTLRYSPSGAAKLYREKAGRSRRIGSGMSNGPDGGRYSDAFNDEYEMFNRALLSADMTTKQGLSADSDVFSNIFMQRILLENEPIEWVPGNHDRWVEGMVNVIDRNAYNPLVKVLLDNDFSIDEAMRWMTLTPKGREFAARMQWLEGSDFTTSKTIVKPFEGAETPLERAAYEDIYAVDEAGRETKITSRITPFETREQNPISGMIDERIQSEQMRAYVTDVAFKIRQQMQEIPAFFELQRSRAQQVADGVAVRTTPEDVWEIIDNLSPKDVQRLGAVQGSMIIESGTEGFWNIWRGLVDKMFTLIGTIPEDAVVRGPFYNKRFRQVRDDLIENYWAQNPQAGVTSAKDVRKARKRLRTEGGREIDGTIVHDQFTIPKKEMDRIYSVAHRQALQDTRDWMYTIERRTKLGKYGEYIFPFVSAQQNSLTVGGRLLWRNPWLAPVIVDLWRAPTRLGWEDEEGNLRMPMPNEAIRHFLDENLPIVGGLVGKGEFITIPKDGLNVFMPDTGFGVLPRPAAWAQVSASELMKMGAFPVETPTIFKSVFGDEGGVQAYQTLKDYIFGQEGTMSSKPGSWDMLLPAAFKRVIEGRDEMSAQYGYQYSLQWATENARYVAGERDTRPTSEEIAKKTTDMFWFMWFGNMGIPTPMTPYPILTRPEVQKYPLEFLQERFKAYQKANPKDAAYNFYRDYGDMLLPLAMTQVSKNVGGANATGETVSDIKRLDSLIRDVTPDLGEDLSLLDILVNNREPALQFDESAYQWEKATRIAGTGETWRQQQSPEEAESERMRQAGWTEYNAFMDRLDAQLFSLGLTNYQQSGAALLRQAKDRFIMNKAMDKTYEAWFADYQDSGGNKTKKAVMVLEKAVSNPEFREMLMQGGKENLLGAMDEYVYYRRTAVQAVAESGAGWNDPENIDIREAWLNIRQELSNRDVRFSEIMNRWLANDENPQFPGDYIVNPMIEAQMRGQYVG